MSAVLATPISQIHLLPGSAFQIEGVTWESYISLLQQLGDNRATRVAYENGVLEIRMPGPSHEAANRVLATIALILAEEFGFKFNDLGSLTMNRPQLSKGIEPDSCFYIQNAQPGQGLSEPIATDLPPDLALEVDIANRSDSKLSIYQAMGVPEIWLYQQNKIKIIHLQNGIYQEALSSRAFPLVSTEQLNNWVELQRTGTDLTVVRSVREFCRTRG